MNIIELAKEVGFIINGGRIESPYIGGSDISHRLKEFAALVRAEALEEAAKVCEKAMIQMNYSEAPYKQCAAAIRARGETK